MAKRSGLHALVALLIFAGARLEAACNRFLGSQSEFTTAGGGELKPATGPGCSYREHRLGCGPDVISGNAVLRMTPPAPEAYGWYGPVLGLSPSSPPVTFAEAGASLTGAAIEAALAPAETDFLYFVSRNDGSHVFSRSAR